MGIEPTDDTLFVPPNGFEDRGRHQAYKHFLRYTHSNPVQFLMRST